MPILLIYKNVVRVELIGKGCESRGLYYLGTSLFVCCVASASQLLHERLRHPHLTKLKKDGS